MQSEQCSADCAQFVDKAQQQWVSLPSCSAAVKQLILFLCVVDSTVVSWMGASPLCKEGSGVHAAPSSSSHVSGTACGWRDGCLSGARGWLQHPFWRLHLCQDCPQVSRLAWHMSWGISSLNLKVRWKTFYQHRDYLLGVVWLFLFWESNPDFP